MAGTALTGNTPASTYGGLMKTTDSAVVNSTLRLVSDGMGNEIPLKVSTVCVSVGGTNTNDSASAGYIGEFLSANAASSAVALTTETPANATSLSLTAGDWDVSCDIRFAADSASTAITYIEGGISQTTATLPSGGVSGGLTTLPVNVNTNLSSVSLVIPTIRVSLASTTTIYLVAQASFTVAGCHVGGSIRARRVR